MRRIKLIIAYDGTDYSGWQVQRNPASQPARPCAGKTCSPEFLPTSCLDNAVTIEGTLQVALSDLLEAMGEDREVKLIGASRTDAGVHAEGNVAVFDTDAKMPAEKFAYALNARLPEDIKVLQSEEVSDNFHPRYTLSHKTYVYQILNTPVPIPTLTRYMHYLYEDIDINRMRQAEDIFIGEHDFSAFCSAGAQVKSKVRTIESLKVTAEQLSCQDQTDAQSLTNSVNRGKIVKIEVTGTGFLYNMVRIIAGTLIEVGLGRRDIDTVRRAIATGDRSLAGPTAPAKGLILKKIIYDKD